VLLEATAEVARVAGNIAKRYYGSDVVVEQKADATPVTIADRSAEAAAREWIITHFPADGIIGEELPPHRPEARRRWVVDPIDGTKTFVTGVPLWGTLIGVCEGDTVLAGAAFFPAVDEMLVAAQGEGCWWNEKRARVSDVRDVSASLVLTTDERFVRSSNHADGWRRLTERARLVRTWGDCYGYLLVATGRAEVMLDPTLSIWDAAPLYPLLVEAGGVVTDWTGKSTAFGGGIVATNAGVAATTRELLGVQTT
jgi:histidinol-phosphatase